MGLGPDDAIHSELYTRWIGIMASLYIPISCAILFIHNTAASSSVTVKSKLQSFKVMFQSGILLDPLNVVS